MAIGVLMLGLALTTYDRISPAGEDADRRQAFERSYLGMRLVIGTLGLALPWALVLLDIRLDGEIGGRGSMSAYYHSGARDLFVGMLFAVGMFLVTYMWWHWRTWDFVWSSLAGIGAMGLAFFPTARDRSHLPENGRDIPEGEAGCIQVLKSPCSAIQKEWDEDFTRLLHLGFTAIVVASFFALAVVFALRSFGYGPGARDVNNQDVTRLGVRSTLKQLRTQGGWKHVWRHLWMKARRVLLYSACACGVLVGVAWIAFEVKLGWAPALVGEIIAFTSFGIAWLTAGIDLLRRANRVAGAAPVTSTSTGAPAASEEI